MKRLTALKTCIVLLAACSIGLAEPSPAVPLLVSYQGRLENSIGEPVNINNDVNLRIFSTPSGGVALWSELHPNVPFSDGLFNLTLGSTVFLSSDVLAPPSSGPAVVVERYLEVQIGGDPPLTPRVRLVAAPYAVAARRMSGDVETVPGELRLSGMGGSTTATIRSSNNPADPGSSLTMEVDSDHNGLPDRQILMDCDDTDARLAVSNIGSSGQDGISIAVADSSSSFRVLSLNGLPPGVPVTGTLMIHTDPNTSSMELGDPTGDGRAVLTCYRDSVKDEISVKDALGNEYTKKGYTSTARSDTYLSADRSGKHSDIQGTCDSTGARSILTGHQGSTTGTIRMQASPDTAGGLCEHSSPGGVAHSVAWNTDADGASLRVANIGSSGQDGVSIELGASSRRLTMGNLGSSGQDGVDMEVGSSLRRLTVGNIGSSGQDGVSVNVDGTSRRLTVGNIGSSGQDGVDVEVDGASRRLTVGNIGSSGQDGVSVEVDGTSRRLTVGNIGSSGQDGVSVDVRSSSSKLVVHNIGSSGNDGVSILDDGSGGRIAVDTIPTTHKISIGGGGAYCDGTDWVNGSDVNTKENFKEVNGEDILEKIEDLSISQWNFKKDGDAVKHIGPTAQDFKATFGVGANDKSISTIDPSGIALAAIKQLIKENEELRARIAKLEKHQAKAQAR